MGNYQLALVDTANAMLSTVNAKAELPKVEALYRLRPNLMNLCNLLCVYYTLGMSTESKECADAIVSALGDPGNLKKLNNPNAASQALLNCGLVYRGFGFFQQGSDLIHRAWELDKSQSYAGMAEAEELLREGNWSEGWKIHNKCRPTTEAAALSLGLPMECKFWDGEETPGHLMVINEGGAGDRINYTRFLPLLTGRNISWSFFCYDELKSFYGRLPWIGPDRLIGEQDKKEFSPAPSHWTTTFSLAGPLGIARDAVPDFPSPFTALPSDLNFTHADSRPMVGISWSANELFQGGLKIRSMTEGQAMRLISLTASKVAWVNMQHGHRMPFPVANVKFNTWEDTAVMIGKMDAVVAVDSGTYWMSTAMGKPTALVLTCSNDWKFGTPAQGDKCIWSPSAKIYRNPPSSDLFDIERAIDKLIMDIHAGAWPPKEK